MRDPSAKPASGCGAAADLSRHEEALAVSESPGAQHSEREREVTRSINQRIFETSLDLILVVDRKGKILRVSPSSVSILRRRPEEMVGRSAAEFVDPEDLECTRTEMRLARRGHAMRHFQCRYMHKDGHPVPLAWAGVWSEPDQQHFFIGRDMTDRLAAEERLRHLQRLDAMGRLTGGIAHDFNNLLSIVIGNLDLLQLEVADMPEARELVEAALDAGLRGSEITKQLLAFSRRQPLQPQAVNLNDIVTHTARLLKHTLGEHVRVRTVLDPDLSTAEADPAQIESALMNLAINARDAMPAGGQLVIETADKYLDSDYAAENPEVTPGDYVMLAVSDTGTGMAPEIRDRVFEPFFTTKGNNGTGLGLSMVYGFAKQSRGHAKVYSEPGHGTTVRLYLPRSTRQIRQENGPRTQTSDSALQGKTILAVDDNPGVLDTVGRQLNRLGYQVLSAESSAAALEILRSGQSVDLLFTDVVMPEGSGTELARSARQFLPGLKVLLTSGFTESTVRQSSAAQGFRLLSKPYQLHELAQEIAYAFRQEGGE